MSIRLRRLQADYDKILETFAPGGKIQIKNTVGNPPEKYQVEYLVNSLVMRPDGSVQMKTAHLVEVFLTRGYPRQAPQCRMLTPIFHPNIAPHAICIGDHWAAGESLPHLLLRIGEMLTFQSYNLKSPLNGEAAKWVEKNKQKLPVDKFDFSHFLETSDKVLSQRQVESISAETVMACSNCGASVTGHSSIVCSSNHVVCLSCAIPCAVCGKQLCLKCLSYRCTKCNRITCNQCHFKCAGCKADLCSSHTEKCHVCNVPVCEDCHVACTLCGKVLCLDHLKQAADGSYRCSGCLNA